MERRHQLTVLGAVAALAALCGLLAAAPASRGERGLPDPAHRSLQASGRGRGARRREEEGRAAGEGRRARGLGRDPKTVVLKDDAPPLPMQSAGQCPPQIRDAMGIYASPSNGAASGLESVLLLVSANLGHYDLLLNWEYMAQNLGLKYGIVAMDDALYDSLTSGKGGPLASYPGRHVIKADHLTTASASGFRDAAFKTISCNKLEIAVDLMRKCDADVVFSDVDNAFLKDPFAHDLGRLIRMGTYDYVYTSNRPSDCLDVGRIPGGGGNTGFHYLARRSGLLMDVVDATVNTCGRPDNADDDQTIFWKELLGRYQAAERGGDTWRHCSARNGYRAPGVPDALFGNGEQQSSLNLCCLDHAYYKGGKDFDYKKGPVDAGDTVTYHANFAGGKPKKVQKLSAVGAWHPEEIQPYLEGMTL